MRRVKHPASLSEALARLIAYRHKHGPGPHYAAQLADSIWPGAPWVAPQGAGAAASRVVKRLGGYWAHLNGKQGWMLCSLKLP